MVTANSRLFTDPDSIIFTDPDSGSIQKIFFVTFASQDIKKTCLLKYIENFTIKNWKSSDKNPDIFHISAQNIDCGY